MTESLTAYLGLGSNLGDRRQSLSQARLQLAQVPEVELVASSQLFESEPVGGPAGQPRYLNAVVALQTTLDPIDLLTHCLAIERLSGRQRHERWGARTLDIDLLLIGELQSATADLTLPHPRMAEREFVLRPLAELDAELVHPLLKQSIMQLLNMLPPAANLTCLGAW